MIRLPKSGSDKMPLDRVPALNADPAFAMRQRLASSIGVTAVRHLPIARARP